ncbi:excinuclease ABC subunit UvrC [Ruminococcus sp.]|uniref:excinuclease ABC subunit UvrC n=1 Tax=Ruminococcus sp. TaxID=41978 RepID=UPI001B6804E2|nr:excinuclease ABC subunit UvrC [Ruminococcus sp.]MBP5431754.1 excinuclease ABC subunit UvrC [Ruminococcus sp.]
MNPRLPYLREKTAKLTASPGVYIMRKKDSSIIYIGKAKNLHNRVSSYFRENPDHTPKVAAMVSNVYDYDFIVTDSEFEALLLECSLIKQHKPKYNILLKDDKGYHYIRISDDEYPRITNEKNTKQSGTYLGPYTSGYITKEAVNEANRVFMLPTCKRHFPQDFGKSRPCLNYHIKQCMGVCKGRISAEDYRSAINQAVEFIKSGSAESVERMKAEMERAAEDLDFEKAAMLRDRITAVKKASEKQKIINSGVESADVLGVAEFYDGLYISVLMYREDRLFDKAVFELPLPDRDEEILSQFMLQFYYKKPDIPKNIVVDHIPADSELIVEMLETQADRKVKLHVPQKGRQLELLRLAKNNSAEYAAIKNSRTGKEVIALEQLGQSLGLSKPPRYIEAYDISNLSSESMVAGMVVFEDGRPLKKAYKRFTVKEQELQNDYGSMREVLKRRLMHIITGEGDEYFTRTPDLILLDGGKGHVNAVEPLIRELGLDIPLFGMVKDDKHRTRAIATGGREIQISSVKVVFDLVTRIQDEVHRFSVSFMHSRHKKKTYSSELLNVRGIGEKKAAKLFMRYKTIANLKKASPYELAVAAGVSQETANELWEVIREM